MSIFDFLRGTAAFQRISPQATAVWKGIFVISQVAIPSVVDHIINLISNCRGICRKEMGFLEDESLQFVGIGSMVVDE